MTDYSEQTPPEWADLEREAEAVLRGRLPAPLCATIRRLLERGAHPADVLAACVRAGATEGTMTRLAIEREIAAVVNELRCRRN